MVAFSYLLKNSYCFKFALALFPNNLLLFISQYTHRYIFCFYSIILFCRIIQHPALSFRFATFLSVFLQLYCSCNCPILRVLYYHPISDIITSRYNRFSYYTLIIFSLFQSTVQNDTMLNYYHPKLGAPDNFPATMRQRRHLSLVTVFLSPVFVALLCVAKVLKLRRFAAQPQLVVALLRSPALLLISCRCFILLK